MFVRRKSIGCDSGSSAIEFALVAPAFFGMIFGVFWIGWAAFCTHSVHHALDMSARALQLKPTMSQNELLVLVRSKVSIGANDQNITVGLTLDPASSGATLAHLSAAFPLSFSIPFFGDYSINYSTSVTVPVSAS